MSTSRPARLLVDRKADNAPHRCDDCGRKRSGGFPCPEHPTAALEPWPARLDRVYLQVHDALSRFPAPLDPNDPVLYPGQTPGEVALCAAKWERWGRDTLPERRRVEEEPIAALFGRPQQ